VHFPNILDKKGVVVQFPRDPNRTRGKRDIYYYSDDLQEDDFDLFKSYLGSGGYHRYKRALPSKPRFTKENATLYCMEKVSNTKVGKLCASLGANVQAKVNSCSIDLEVFSFLIYSVEAKTIAGFNFVKLLCCKVNLLFLVQLLFTPSSLLYHGAGYKFFFGASQG